MTSWRTAVRRLAVDALHERRRWAHSAVDQHCVARAIAYQDMASRLIRLIDQHDAQAPEPETTTAPSDDMPAGTRVLAFLDHRHGRALVTTTNGPVRDWFGIPVVSVAGHDTHVALTHIEVLPA